MRVAFVCGLLVPFRISLSESDLNSQAERQDKLMATYAVDSLRQPMIATAIVEPVMEWEETPDGRRRPSERQARNEDTGMTLWAVEVLYTQTAFGRESTVTAKVTVGAEQQPVPARLAPIAFAGLRVEARANRAGGFVEVWSAESLMEATRSSGRQSNPSVSGASTSSAAA